MKRTKIIATIGPACGSKEKIGQLIEAGINVARINFSHGDHQSNGEFIRNVKELRQEQNLPIGIMIDLQGPRIRTIVERDVEITEGELIGVFDASQKNSIPPRQEKILKFIGLDWKDIIKDIKVGNDILIEDGLIRLQVMENNNDYLTAEVKEGGTVKNHKGVNIPDAQLKIGSLTEKDEEDLKFALEQDADFIALSFVSEAKDILKLRQKMEKISGRSENLPQIVAKIERKEAIKNISEIIKTADAVMVARGDLGIEMDESRVAIYQKEIIALCLRSAKPVIVATQMLNSMIENPRPTRAEVSDVSNAVIDHADAVMLSGETAFGKYPIRSVKVMNDIIKKTEGSPFDVLAHGFLGDKKSSISSAVAHSAHELLKDTDAEAVIAASLSGFTARMVARHRPEKQIYVMTNNPKTHNQLSLVWGIRSLVLPECRTLDELIDRSIKSLIENKLVKIKSNVVIVAGRPGVSKEHMSLVKIEEVD
jgi:pyruvate kinase